VEDIYSWGTIYYLEILIGTKTASKVLIKEAKKN
jgi:hypothetical protein